MRRGTAIVTGVVAAVAFATTGYAGSTDKTCKHSALSGNTGSEYTVYYHKPGKDEISDFSVRMEKTKNLMLCLNRKEFVAFGSPDYDPSIIKTDNILYIKKD